ncbi:MAG: protein translocase subunit secB [Burkholderiales bacterium]|jgi:preprotein translocase subunit SecB|nr:protein translocase subunit secB [Burkholderiales bacterium]
MSEPQQPAFGIQKIYLKDMSLEIPNSPQIFLERDAPQVDVNLHNEARPLGQPGLFEVVLTVTVTAKIDDKTVFLVEAAQAGIFEIVNVPTPELEAVLGIVCPNTLLPYAREAVASTVTRAGFPPVVLQHMSFETIYQQRQEQLREQPSAPPAH